MITWPWGPGSLRSLHVDVDIADETENGRADGGLFADAIALKLAGGCSVRLDLVTIFTRSIAGGSDGDLSLEEGEAGAVGKAHEGTRQMVGVDPVFVVAVGFHEGRRKGAHGVGIEFEMAVVG